MTMAFLRPLIPLAALLAAVPARASDVDLLSGETVFVSGDLRVLGTDGENSWADGGFGKVRSSGTDGGGMRVKPELGTADLVWQPRLGWALSATVVGTVQGGERTEAGLSEAFVSYKPLTGGKVRISARAGLMWVPVSLEHAGADWHVADTITPSAINSWIGEEVRPLALEGTAIAQLGEHQLSATAAVFAANDTAGTLLTFRGWALHDRKTLAFRRQPLPHLPEQVEYYQPPFTHPLLDVDTGFAKRPGYYAKLAWTPPLPVRVELFHYDNRADPTVLNEDLEWGWRTQFSNVGAVLRLGPATELKGQAVTGRTRMGMTEENGIWIDCRFHSAFAMLVHDFGFVRAAARFEGFDTRQKGGLIDDEYDETGWAATIAVQRQFGPNLTGVAEVLHVNSYVYEREEIGEEERQRQTQVQASLRFHW
jgi:hypothetical protein